MESEAEFAGTFNSFKYIFTSSFDNISFAYCSIHFYRKLAFMIPLYSIIK